METKLHNSRVTIAISADKHGKVRMLHTYLNRARPTSGEVIIERESGDTDLLPNITKADAVKIIDALRHTFDIPDHNANIAEALRQQAENAAAKAEELILTTVANLMYENGMRTACLTPSRILASMTPAVAIDATRPDLITYVLKEDPLNVSEPTPNTCSACGKQTGIAG